MNHVKRACEVALWNFSLGMRFQLKQLYHFLVSALSISMNSLSLRAFLQGIHRDSKGSGPYAVTLLYWTPTCKWYMARLLIKIRHQNDVQ